MGIIDISVVGVTFGDRPNKIKRISEAVDKGKTIDVSLKPVKNEYDPMAVAVCYMENGKSVQVGFVPKEIAGLIRMALHDNMVKKVVLDDVGYDEQKKIPWMRIKVGMG